jgi:hypothetical protein
MKTGRFKNGRDCNGCGRRSPAQAARAAPARTVRSQESRQRQPDQPLFASAIISAKRFADKGAMLRCRRSEPPERRLAKERHSISRVTPMHAAIALRHVAAPGSLKSYSRRRQPKAPGRIWRIAPIAPSRTLQGQNALRMGVAG